MSEQKMHETEEKVQKFVLFAAEGDDAVISAESSLAELSELLATAGGETAGYVIQKRDAVHPKTYLGTGKAEELKNMVATTEADGAICDDELSPSQLKALTDLVGVKVLDRTLLILDIFTQRANTREGKIQVELAQLNYRLTRLTGLGTELSRQGGSTGGAHSRGAGEKKLELDRRAIRLRIDQLNRELKDVEAQRALLRKGRENKTTPVVALVGYTNAGKSTLFNRLTSAGVLEENKLFATLDTTVRAVTLPSGRDVLLTDTVGFIHKLPHHLVKAFRATLEEAAFADVLIHVIDNSDPESTMQAQVTYDTLTELGAGDKPILAVLNKEDLRTEESIGCHLGYPARDILHISALSEDGPARVLEALEKLLASEEEELCILLPYKEGAMLDQLHRETTVLGEQYLDEGIGLTLRLGRDSALRRKLVPYEK